jgi:hypothetical protein
MGAPARMHLLGGDPDLQAINKPHILTSIDFLKMTVNVIHAVSKISILDTTESALHLTINIGS